MELLKVSQNGFGFYALTQNNRLPTTLTGSEVLVGLIKLTFPKVPEQNPFPHQAQQKHFLEWNLLTHQVQEHNPRTQRAALRRTHRLRVATTKQGSRPKGLTLPIYYNLAFRSSIRY